MFGRIALVLTATVLCNTGCAEKKLLAEHVFLDAVIYTADADQRTAEAMAVAGDKIVFIGSNKGAMALIGATTTVDRLDGKMLIPGLHDSHIHLPGIIEGDSCDLASGPYSLQQLVPRLEQCIKDQQLAFMVIRMPPLVPLDNTSNRQARRLKFERRSPR